jgi:hypothetical protein
MDRPDTAITEDVSALLDEVEATVRRGDFDALPQLTARMEQAEAGLHRPGRDDLLRIRRLADRNARTLSATRRGIKAAQRRIAEVFSAARGLVTYDRLGHRVEESEAREFARRF